MEKLGLAAKLGVKRVFRQAIFGGNYALLDKELDPLPVGFTIFFHKLISTQKYFYFLIFNSRTIGLHYYSSA